MNLYSFFLDLRKLKNKEFPFMTEHSYCLKKTYKGTIPVIKENDVPIAILYGMTTSKQIRDMFKSTRNMSLFIEHKAKITKSEIKDMMENLHFLVLDEVTLFDSETPTEDLSKVQVAISCYEKEYVQDELNIITNIQDTAIKSSLWVDFIERDIITEEAKDVLSKFKFLHFIDLVSYGFGANDSDVELLSDDLYSILESLMTDTVYKTFEVFIKNFGFLMDI